MLASFNSLRPMSVAVSAAALAINVSAQGQVWQVDDDLGPGVDFADIQSAVNAAGDGDLIRVAGGSYAAFDVTQKALTIVADSGAVVVAGSSGFTTRLRQSSAAQTLVLRGLDFQRAIDQVGSTLEVDACLGPVWIEDCEILPSVVGPFGASIAQEVSFSVDQSPQVVCSQLRVTGAPANNSGLTLNEASVPMRVASSSVYLFEAELYALAAGGVGATGPAGIELSNAFLFLRNSTVNGGTGGPAAFIGAPNSGAGGAGVLTLTDAEVWSRGSEVEGGAGGQDALGTVMGPAGPAFSGGAVASLPSGSVPLQLDAVVSAGTTVNLMVQAEASAAVVLAVSLSPQPVFVPVLSESSAVGAAPLLVPLGSTDAFGMLNVPVPVPELPAGWGHFGYPLQAYAVSPETDVELSRPTFLTTLGV